MTNTPSKTSKAGETYFVYADYGYVSERKIAQSDNFAEMKRVFEEETAKPSKMDCTVIIELASFAENGEFKVHDSQTPEEDWVEDGIFDDNHLPDLAYF